MPLPRRAFLLLPAICRAQPAGFERQTLVYKHTPQCAIKADVFRAPGGGSRPALVWIHGGALIWGSRASLESSRREQLRRYLNAGFVVVSIDYRLAPETKLPAILEDVRDACEWVRREGSNRFGADPGRVALVGHSAGGYLGLQMAWSLKKPPKAVASYYGYGEIAGDWCSQPSAFYRRQPLVTASEAMLSVGASEIAEPPAENQRQRFYLYARQNGLWPKLVAGVDPLREARKLTPYCPVRHVTRRYPPAILLHGREDTDVPYEKSVEMAKALERNGVAHDLALLPGLGHGFDHDMDNPVVSGAFDRGLEFLLKHVTANAY
ncbi:MAG: alpha/beta hydrolase [Bryobacteraceae bacterium]|jgi:acetyl esterase/lipase